MSCYFDFFFSPFNALTLKYLKTCFVCRGNGASVLRIVPYAALHFMTYEQYRCWILNNYPILGSGPIIDLLAGSAAGGTAVLCTYPLDLARTKLAYQVSFYYLFNYLFNLVLMLFARFLI